MKNSIPFEMIKPTSTIYFVSPENLLAQSVRELICNLGVKSLNLAMIILFGFFDKFRKGKYCANVE